jgi:hypothetical protein
MTVRAGDRYYIKFGYKVKVCKITAIYDDYIEFMFPFITIFGKVLQWYGPLGLTYQEFRQSIRSKADRKLEEAEV